jgi:hypothetical protein
MPKSSAQYSREWREKNRERWLKHHREYQKKVRHNNPLPARWKNTRNRAKRLGLELGITKEQYFDLALNYVCYICGRIPNTRKPNGVDRVDNSKGYTLENCKTCCYSCNSGKRDRPLECYLQCKKQKTRDTQQPTLFTFNILTAKDHERKDMPPTEH